MPVAEDRRPVKDVFPNHPVSNVFPNRPVSDIFRDISNDFGPGFSSAFGSEELNQGSSGLQSDFGSFFPSPVSFFLC